MGQHAPQTPAGFKPISQDRTTWRLPKDADKAVQNRSWGNMISSESRDVLAAAATVEGSEQRQKEHDAGPPPDAGRSDRNVTGR